MRWGMQDVRTRQRGLLKRGKADYHRHPDQGLLMQVSLLSQESG